MARAQVPSTDDKEKMILSEAKSILREGSTKTSPTKESSNKSK